MNPFAERSSREDQNAAPVGGRGDALVWTVLGVVLVGVGWGVHRLLIIGVGVFVLVPGLLMLLLDRIAGRRPAVRSDSHRRTRHRADAARAGGGATRARHDHDDSGGSAG
ncbi:hypothetical protein [Luteipulveratus flavus]|uniref:TM2 domain-containing protein n=1 Tax=Luteipulveratus flavus TaxID=3031728 RepID=A0ABT6C5U2_9MICO|nr:hypothetical protein [Luteipulveratus sp. YIM 133296]MDF8263702.1 hypothetical protein [Luteipulveratus sp. YIM 133296]